MCCWSSSRVLTALNHWCWRHCTCGWRTYCILSWFPCNHAMSFFEGDCSCCCCCMPDMAIYNFTCCTCLIDALFLMSWFFFFFSCCHMCMPDVAMFAFILWMIQCLNWVIPCSFNQSFCIPVKSSTFFLYVFVPNSEATRIVHVMRNLSVLRIKLASDSVSLIYWLYEKSQYEFCLFVCFFLSCVCSVLGLWIQWANKLYN